MSADVSPPVAWGQPLTLADQLVIDALPDDVRASVERYIVASTGSGSKGPLTPEFIRGWNAGAEAMREEIEMTPIPHPPSKAR